MKSLPITSITSFTLQDFPDRAACILWFGGCNFRCSYCHNPELIFGKKKKLSKEDIIKFLESRRNLLEGVVFSGGECTLCSGIVDFAKEIKDMGFLVKVDTNGTNPNVLREMAKQNLMDYVAIDYKAPQDKFKDVTASADFEKFSESLDFMCNSNIPLEVRTTIHTVMLNETDIRKIIKDLEDRNFRGNYFVQNFNEGETLIPMPKQKRRLNVEGLPTPKGFSLGTRNFG